MWLSNKTQVHWILDRESTAPCVRVEWVGGVHIPNSIAEIIHQRLQVVCMEIASTVSPARRHLRAARRVWVRSWPHSRFINKHSESARHSQKKKRPPSRVTLSHSLARCAYIDPHLLTGGTGESQSDGLARRSSAAKWPLPAKIAFAKPIFISGRRKHGARLCERVWPTF